MSPIVATHTFVRSQTLPTYPVFAALSKGLDRRHLKSCDQSKKVGEAESQPKYTTQNGHFEMYIRWGQQTRGRGGGGRDLLERGGGEGGRGSRGGGEGVQGGGVPPPPRNVPSPQGTENLLGNEPLSTWKCHLVGSKQS